MTFLTQFGDRVSHLSARILSVGLNATIVGFCAAVVIVYQFSHDLPDYRQLSTYEPPIVTRLYAGDGRLLAEYATEKRVYVPLKAMPRRLIQAFVAAEDRNFFTHSGIDPYGIFRAARDNIANMGRGGLAGGSTITQQVVKNFLLTSEKSITRKIKEAILALRISQVFSKEKVLELYLNEIYLGVGSYGVAAASLNYFNKSMDELSTEEAALLAAMPKAPSNYDPRRNYQAALERRNYVIQRMYDDRYISAAEARQAASMPIVLRQRDPTETARADFFAEEVRRQLASKYGSEVLYQGGLTVKTTLSPEFQYLADAALREALTNYDRRHGWRGPVFHLNSLSDWQSALEQLPKQKPIELFGEQKLAAVLAVEPQKAIIGLEDGKRGIIPLDEVKWARAKLPEGLGAEPQAVGEVLKTGDVVIVYPIKAVKDGFGLHQIPEVNGALVVMDPHTHRVLALSGGYSYGKTEFNRATQAKRQPGSAFKPFVYLAALESGFGPTTVVLDAPVELYQGPGLPMWRPKNYGGDFLGPATLRTGVEKSRNAMTVRLAQMVGIGRIIRIAKRFGIYEKLPRNFSIVLGSHETTLLKLTNAYAAIVNGGLYREPELIERIDDRHGKVIFRRDGRECKKCKVLRGGFMAELTPPIVSDDRERILDARVAYQMTSILEGVVQRGTAVSAKVLGRPLGGKTGTTNESRDVWFVGFSPDLVAGVYIGYDQPKPLGAKETGGRVALPAFISFMKEALKDVPPKPFKPPVSGIQQVMVDTATGLPAPAGSDRGGVVEEVLVTGEIYVPPPPEGEEEESLPATPQTQEAVANPDAAWTPGEQWEGETPDYATGSPPQTDEELQLQFRRPLYEYRALNANPYEARRRAAEQRPVPSGAEGAGTGGLY